MSLLFVAVADIAKTEKAKNLAEQWSRQASFWNTGACHRTCFRAVNQMHRN